MRLARLALLLFLPLLSAARAQNVHWETTDDPGALALVFTNCAPDGDPVLPAVPDVQFSYAGTSESTQTSFGSGGYNSTHTISLTYRLRSRGAGAFTIPAFEVKSDKGPMRVAAFTGGARANSGLDNAATSRLTPAQTAVWAGEVFPLTYTLDVIRRNFSQLSPTIEWNPSPLISEEWTKPEANEILVNGEARFNIVYKSRALVKTPGALTLNSAAQLVNLQTGSIGFGIFQTPRVEQLNVESNRPKLTVRPLPPAPPGFSGAVGEFKLVSKVVPERAAVGEPVTWTLELSGTGNWPDIAGLPSREVSNDFQVVQPKAKRTPVEGKLFDVTLAEDVVLVPTKAGTYSLGAVNFVYFDPRSGSYKTISAPRTELTIGAAGAPKLFNPAPAAPAAPPPGPVAAETDPLKIDQLKSKPPAPPAAIPRDPLSGRGAARTPLEPRTLAAAVSAPFALLLVCWLGLAGLRAHRTDPARPRREARLRLAATIARLRAKPSPELLIAWQHDAAILWQIAHAAPAATALPETAWATLWTEADRSLYGVKSDLPPDWVARAEACLAAKRVPGFLPLRLFLPRNLLPFAAAAALLLIPGAALRALDQAPAGAAKPRDPAAAYRQGDFAAAEQAWRRGLATSPDDWIARHNLSLALAQLDRAPEAAAHAAAAFVQHPSDPAVRWHLGFTAEKANVIPAALTGFLAPGPLASLARQASPADWQLALVLASSLAATSLGVMLVNAYGRRSRPISWAARAVVGLALLLAAAALVGLHGYGATADARAVIVWRTGTLRSIPTEADTAQKTTPLTAGSVAIADRAFLGWKRLSFENGQTGWVRQEDLVPIWH